MKRSRKSFKTLVLVALMAVFVCCTAESCSIGDGNPKTLHRLCEQFNSCPQN